MKKYITDDFLYFSMWAVAFLATAGSLYLSEVLKYVPCTLCWYQRIFMYPLTVIMTIMLIKKQFNLLQIAILASIGWIIAAYHYAIQMIPSAESLSFCGMGSCSGKYIDWFGFITIPFMSLVAFSIILLGCIVSKKMAEGEHAHA